MRKAHDHEENRRQQRGGSYFWQAATGYANPADTLGTLQRRSSIPRQRFLRCPILTRAETCFTPGVRRFLDDRKRVLRHSQGRAGIRASGAFTLQPVTMSLRGLVP